MNRRALLAGSTAVVIGSVIPSSARAAGAAGADADFGAMLKRYVSASPDGIHRVDYRRWSASGTDREGLKAYIREMEMRRPSTLARPDLFAFWCNIYNAVTVQIVLDNYPIASIRDVKSDGLLDPKAYFGPWRTKRLKVEGRDYSLDDIEHVAMRPVFNDARVHYAVNCASLGCPNLQPQAWSAATLETDLDAAARQFVNHPRGIVSVGPGKLKVSSIYKWFKADFDVDGGVLAHARKFADPKLAAAIDGGAQITEDAYDWSLNEISREG